MTAPLTPDAAVCPARCARHRPPHLHASGGLYRRGGQGAARRAAGRALQEPLPQGPRRGLWLVVMLEERRTDLKKLSDRLGAPRFSFGSAALLQRCWASPRAASPPSRRSTTRRAGHRGARAEMLECPLNYHPLTNEATTAIAPADLLAFTYRLRSRPARPYYRRMISGKRRRRTPSAPLGRHWLWETGVQAASAAPPNLERGDAFNGTIDRRRRPRAARTLSRTRPPRPSWPM